MKYMGQVKYLSNESQKQSRCVRIAIFFYWKCLTTVFQVAYLWKILIFLCVKTTVYSLQPLKKSSLPFHEIFN